MQQTVSALFLGALVVAAAPASADGVLSSKSRLALFQNQTRLLDERAATQYAASARLLPDPTVGGGSRIGGGDPGPYLDMARSAARRHGIPETLFVRLVRQESGWNARARSPKGALGLAQLMPVTARSLGVDPMNPAQNLEGGARYLRAQFNAFGSWRLALAAYNAGPDAVRKYGGIPPYRETQNYVRAILGG